MAGGTVEYPFVAGVGVPDETVVTIGKAPGAALILEVYERCRRIDADRQ